MLGGKQHIPLTQSNLGIVETRERKKEFCAQGGVSRSAT